MATSLLVVTPSPSFGELIRRPLEETGQYRVHIVNSKAAAIVRADEESCQMAFLDIDLGDTWVEEVGLSLRTVIPNIKLFLLAGDETPPAFDSIRPWTLIRKPLQLPVVLATIGQPAPASADDTHDLLWLSDVNKAAQHLTRLTLESSSQAALITRDNALWAYAGQLSQDAAQEVARVLVRNWDGAKGGDLLRFVRLEATRAEHMLYATQLTEGMLLAMVFDAETPFSTIRSQAGQLATSLAEGENSEQPELPAPPTAAPAPIQPEQPESAAPAFSDLEDEEDGMEMPPISNILRDIPAPDPRSATPSQIMHDIPSPDPRAVAAPVRAQSAAAAPSMLAQNTSVASNATVTEPAPVESQPIPAPAPAQPLDPGLTRPSIFARDMSLPTRLREASSSEAVQPGAQSRPATPIGPADETVASRAQARPETPVRVTQPGELDETRRQEPRTEIASSDLNVGSVTLEPISAGVYHLSYACLLLPRFASHFLTGDMADKLSEWIPIICVAFGWRLEHLAVRPEYLQWVVNVPPATSPGYVMRVIRQQLSDKVFAAFPRLKRDNPSGDFWAPGYLIMGGIQPHPPQLVKDYMRQIRQRQGADKLPTKAPKS